MFRMLDDYKSANADLYDDIQKVYDTCYEVDIPYTCKFDYKKMGNPMDLPIWENINFMGEKKLYCTRFHRVYQKLMRI